MAEGDDEPLVYRVSMQGVEDKGLQNKLEATAVTIRQRRVGVRDAETLAWRAGRDAETMREMMQAEGYRKAAVSASVNPGRRRHDLRLRFRVQPGPRYDLTRVTVIFADAVEERLAARLESLAKGLEGRPARAELILNSEAMLVDALRDAGHALARAGRRTVAISHAQTRAEVTYRIYAGPPIIFGQTIIEGPTTVRTNAIMRKVTWQEGRIFRAGELEKVRRRLLDTDLFLSVRVQEDRNAALAPPVEHGPSPDPLSIPIKLTLWERRHRSIGAGLHYFSDDGLAARLFWENRNLRGGGEKLRIETRYSGFLSDARIRAEVPDYRRLDQSLILRLHWEDERTDVFESRRQDVEARIERRLSRLYSGSLGTGFLHAGVSEPGEPRMQYDLAYFPASLSFDNRDNQLHPTRGFRAIARTVAFVDVKRPAEAAQFYKNMLQMESHHRLLGHDTLGLAFRGGAGVILGASRTRRVPVDQRFYSGGGGSVRGYAYQTLGPERNGKPTGGRSLIEASAELRSRWRESLGTALFLDGGMAFSETVPESLSPMRWSAGLGMRWFTGAGPVRVDLAFPLQGRSSIDSPFSIYVGLGQAF